MNSATISECGKYRYLLHRDIPQLPWYNRRCLFIMLNPSVADATVDDPTIRRCIGFAKREGCTDLTVVNLASLRATNPKQLLLESNPFGPDNWTHLKGQLLAHRRGVIIAAWGSHPFTNTVPKHKEMVSDSGAVCLGVNADGNPKHPLYVPNNAPLLPWRLAV